MDILEVFDCAQNLMARWEMPSISLEDAQALAETMSDAEGQPPARLALNGTLV